MNITDTPMSRAVLTPTLRMMIGTTSIIPASANTWTELSTPYTCWPSSGLENRLVYQSGNICWSKTP